MATQIQGNGGTIAEVDGTTFRALRVTMRPLDYGALGHYAVSAQTGSYTALVANAIMFSARWGDATRFGVVYRFGVQVNSIVAATVAGFVLRELFFVRPFTISDSGGTAVTLTTPNQKMRSSMGASLFTDMRVMGAAGLTAGTGTNDAQALGRAAGSMWTGALTVQMNGVVILAQDVLQDNGGISHPVVLTTNEGLRVLNNPVGPASATLQSTFDIRWAEVTAY